ncbi:MAG: hypothetical protein NVS3B3_19760 [Aquirhabdus sp.]
MGQPAARQGDSHSKGAILEGSKDVRIGGMPAARIGDKAKCGMGTDAIVEGEATVRINNRLAARMGDKHSCDRPIISGCNTVRIGKLHQEACMEKAAQEAAMFVEAESIP